MSWVAAVAASVTATTAAVKWGVAKHNENKDRKNRPQYQIPGEIGKNQTLAQQQYLQGVPEATKAAEREQINQGAAGALSQSSSRGGGLSGIAGLNQQQNQGYAGMAVQDAQARQAGLGTLMGANQTMADYRDQAFQMNTLNPYYEHIKARESRNNALAQGVTDSSAIYASGGGKGGMGGGKGKSGQMQPPSNLNSDLSMKTPQGYNQQTGLTNPDMSNQAPNQYGTINTDTGLTNPFRKQSPYTNPYYR